MENIRKKNNARQNSKPRRVAPMPHSVDVQDKVVRLRISGGVTIDTFEHVLRKDPDSLLAELAKQQLLIDCAHRDGRLLRLLIDGLRKYIGETSDGTFIPPEGFEEWRQLIAEARYWRLHRLEEAIQRASQRANTITVAYHGTLGVGKQGHVGPDINFRRIHRILVCGRAWACRQVFGLNLNETRDGNMDSSRYTSRFYLTHTFLEQAFDALAAHRYKLVSSNSSNPSITTQGSGSVGGGQQMNDQEKRFLHYTQFVFVKYS